eukprot:scaffold100963_cov69-Phaeocystis_antarctica.AAC.6
MQRVRLRSAHGSAAHAQLAARTCICPVHMQCTHSAHAARVQCMHAARCAARCAARTRPRAGVRGGS